LSDWERLLSSAGFEVVSRAPIFYGMIQANDCASTRAAERMDGLWSRLSPWIQRAPGLLGATLYALDSVLCIFVREGPSMELLLARRRA
jgi:hypothetical protein